MRAFSPLGFVVGAILAIIFYVVFTAIVSFEHEDLIAGLVALLIWGACAFGWDGRRL